MKLGTALEVLLLAGCSSASRPPVPPVVEAAYMADVTAEYAAAHSCIEARENLRRVEARWAPAWKAFDRAPSPPPTLRCADGSP